MALISKMHDGVVFLHGIKELIPISIDVIKGSSPLWPGKRSRHSRRMHNQQFYVSRLRPIAFVRLLSDFLTNGHPRWDNFLVTGGDCPHVRLFVVIAVWVLLSVHAIKSLILANIF